MGRTPVWIGAPPRTAIRQGPRMGQARWLASLRMRKLGLTLAALATLAATNVVTAAEPGASAPAAIAEQIARGRYMVLVGGCNDCHTAGYVESNGKVPEKDWLLGNPLGWRGPWGTTFSSNLPVAISHQSETSWVYFARALVRRPPMPWFDLNKWTDADLRAAYRFIKSLGPIGSPVIADLPPDVEPQPPYYQLVLPPQPAK